MASTFGSDFSGFMDIGPGWDFLSGTEGEALALVQAVARRFVMPRGGNPWDPAYGYDLRALLGSTTSPDDAAIAISAEARKDERVADCVADITVIGELWEVAIRCDSAAGPFTLTLEVSSVTVQLITFTVA